MAAAQEIGYVEIAAEVAKRRAIELMPKLPVCERYLYCAHDYHSA